jgi:hypothetical protein
MRYIYKVSELYQYYEKLLPDITLFVDISEFCL